MYRFLAPLTLVAIYGISAAMAIAPALYLDAGFGRLAGAALAPALFCVALVIVAGCISLPFQRYIVEGRFPRDLGHRRYRARRLYGLCWTSVYYCGPAYAAVLAVPSLKWLAFRLFGYRGNLNFAIYPDTWIRDLPLVRLASGAYLSNKATIGTNVCMKDGSIIVGPVTVGANSMVGHLAMIGAGTVIGDNAEVGIGSVIGLRVQIGRDAVIGPVCSVHHGVRIGERCRVGVASFIGMGARIADGIVLPPDSTVAPKTVITSQVQADSLGVKARGFRSSVHERASHVLSAAGPV